VGVGEGEEGKEKRTEEKKKVGREKGKWDKRG
jgi:hypothetical protein